jgi:RNA polymerase sigma-70 factor (ECF subfamily)
LLSDSGFAATPGAVSDPKARCDFVDLTDQKSAGVPLRNVTQASAPASMSTAVESGAPPPIGQSERFRSLLVKHFDFVWRCLRRLGVPSSSVDDAAQEVFWIAARKLDRIEPSSERAFLFTIVIRFASNVRRSRMRSRELSDNALVEAAIDPHADIEVLIDQRRARDLLDVVLDALPFELRTVLMLSEGDGMTMLEIASLLAIPPGTVASRLRRARQVFEDKVEQLLDARRAEEKAR